MGGDNKCDIMAVGFILITVAPTMEHEVYTKLKKLKEIVELYPLFGEYDFIAKAQSEDFNTLAQIILEKIRDIEGVIQTKTLTALKF